MRRLLAKSIFLAAYGASSKGREAHNAGGCPPSSVPFPFIARFITAFGSIAATIACRNLTLFQGSISNAGKSRMSHRAATFSKTVKLLTPFTNSAIRASSNIVASICPLFNPAAIDASSGIITIFKESTPTSFARQ